MLPSRASSTDIPPNAKWKQNGVTVAGGNGLGDENNQFNDPQGLYVDDNETVYVTDRFNYRVMEWKRGATNGKVIAGGNEEGKQANQLSNTPWDVIMDKERDSLIICDKGNARVLRWPLRNGATGETIIPDLGCTGLTMDENGFLYVGNYEKDEVRRYQMGDIEGIVVAGGNGEGNGPGQLHDPAYVFVDRNHTIYVSDYENHRVVKWEEGAKEGIVVAGGQGKGDSLKQLNYPRGVVVDQLGTVYVADEVNQRIMRWPKGNSQGSIIAGENSQGQQSHQLNNPSGLSFDRHGNLYVVDLTNQRVQKFEIE